ncbi:hypothetical protein NIES4074_59880 (plasmid) [Cylindrospermum sp. NIES-4074]|nr:hypothetical protein NIES4074_59880 [Cylindrospermum sp. NIES-4074]
MKRFISTAVATVAFMGSLSTQVFAQTKPLNTFRASTSLLVQANPQDVNTYYIRAFSRLQSEDVKGAIEDYNQVLHPNPNDAKAYHNRGFAGSKLASVEIHFDFNEAEAYLNQSAVHILSGDLKRAIEDSSQAIRLNPNYALAYNNRGFARLLSGDLKEAIEDFTQALRIDPSLAITHNNRGLARFKIGDLKGAIEDFTQALRIDPSLAITQNNQDSNPGQLEDVKGDITKLQKVAKLFKEEGKIAEYQYTLDLIKKMNNR